MQTTDRSPAPVRAIIRLEAGHGAPVITSDTWSVVRDDAQARALLDEGTDALRGKILPVSVYLEALERDPDGLPETGAWIPPDADFEPWAHRLLEAPVVAVDFPTFRDGRGLSVGVMLRTRYGFRHELRAIGDVLRDQLEYMRRCGFDAFAVREDKSLTDALKGFSEISVRYQGVTNDPTPLFRRRANG